MSKQEVTIITQVVSLQVVMDFWLKNYTFPSGVELHGSEFYLDQNKGKVCFVLTTRQDENDH